MAKAYCSTVIDAPVDEVWAAVRDFNGLGTWNAEMVADVRDRGRQGRAIRSARVRNFTLANGAHLREKLLAHSDRDRSYSYDFQKHPFEGVENYYATIQFLPITDDEPDVRASGRTTFDCAPDQIDHWEDFYATEVFRARSEALKAYVAK